MELYRSAQHEGIGLTCLGSSGCLILPHIEYMNAVTT